MGFWADQIFSGDSRATIATRDKLEIWAFAGDPIILELMKPHYYSIRYWRGVDVHGAFLAHYKLIRAILFQSVRERAQGLTGQDVRQRWVTGHGLGGATAQLFAFDMATRGEPVDHVVTFGQPRVGRECWTLAYNHHYRNLTRRYVNHRDPICELPETKKGFLHSVGEQYIDAGGDLSKRNAWWFRTRDELRHEETNGTGAAPLSLDDHAIVEYILKLEKKK